MKLSGPIETVVLDAIEESFNREQITVILRRQLGMRIDRIVRDGLAWPSQVNDIYGEYDLQNTIEKLLVVLRDARPAVPAFALALDELGFAQIEGEGGTGRSAMEALLTRKRTPFHDVADFRGTLSVLEAQVCRIGGPAVGTGSLVGADLVLTNRHVIANAVAADGHGLTEPVTCFFDYKKSDRGFCTEVREVAVARVEASSAHAWADERPGPIQDSPDFLDYALLRLRKPVGNEPITTGGVTRGTIDLTPPGEAPAADSGLVILQHPGGAPMKIDIGSVLARGLTRIRHNVNTKHGSSGAPVFDASLRLVAIHHAGHENGPGPGERGYNQAIPLDCILADARAKDVAL